MAFKLTAAEKILKQCTGKANYGILPTCYLGFSSTVPNADGTNFTEPPGGGYGRTLIGIYDEYGTHKFGEPVNRHIENDEFIYAPETTAPWEGLRYWGFFTSYTGGTPEIWGPLTGAPITIPSGYIPLFRVGEFGIDLA